MEREALRAAALLDRRTTALAARPPRGDGQAARHQPRPMISLIVWGLGESLYGTEVAAVAGVIPFGNCARVPTQVPACLGVIGRAGRFYSVIGLRSLLGLTAPDGAQPRHLLLLCGGAPYLAAAVDHVLGRFDIAGGGGELELDGRLVAPFGPAELLSRLGRPGPTPSSDPPAGLPSGLGGPPSPESMRP